MYESDEVWEKGQLVWLSIANCPLRRLGVLELRLGWLRKHFQAHHGEVSQMPIGFVTWTLSR